MEAIGLLTRYRPGCPGQGSPLRLLRDYQRAAVGLLDLPGMMGLDDRVDGRPRDRLRRVEIDDLGAERNTARAPPELRIWGQLVRATIDANVLAVPLPVGPFRSGDECGPQGFGGGLTQEFVVHVDTALFRAETFRPLNRIHGRLLIRMCADSDGRGCESSRTSVVGGYQAADHVR
jgi:hypothetical protein